MRRPPYLVFCLMTLVFVSPTRAADPTLEEITDAPSKVLGKSFTFDKLTLSGKLIKHTDLWCLKITTEDNTEYSAAVTFAGKMQTFFVSEAIADRLLDDLKEDDSYKVKITCTIVKKKLQGSDAWLAEVTEIGIYKDDKIDKTINAKSPRSGVAPSLERVNDGPQKYTEKAMTFDKVKLLGKMVKHTGLQCLNVESEDGGTKVSAAVHFTGGITFVVSEALAAKLKKRIKEDDSYQVKIVCKISKKKFSGSDAWIAEVSEIGFYTDGKIEDMLK